MTLPDPETSVEASAAEAQDSSEAEGIWGKLGYCYSNSQQTMTENICSENVSPLELFQASEQSKKNSTEYDVDERQTFLMSLIKFLFY